MGSRAWLGICISEPRNDNAEDTALGLEHGKEGPGWDSVRGFLPIAGLKFWLPASCPSSPIAAVTVETCPLRGLLSCLPDASTGWPSLATTSSSSSSSSGLPGAGGQGSPLPISECDPAGAGL